MKNRSKRIGKNNFRLRKFQNAFLIFEIILKNDPGNLTALYGIGQIYHQNNDWKQSVKAYQRVIEGGPSEGGVFVRLAQIQHQQGQTFEALKTLSLAEKQFPNAYEYTYMRGKLAMSAAPSWHLPMLADDSRNNQYEAAINKTVKSGDVVLDIGTGSGILAMMAVRAGAKHVFACESNDLLADAAREIVQLNGYNNQITIISKPSTALVIGEDMPDRADVLVTEIFDNALVGEGILPTLSHAWPNLLKPKARIIPDGATLYGALSSNNSLQKFQQIGRVNGFDLGPMALFAHPLSYSDAEASFENTAGNQIISAPFKIKQFDFKAVHGSEFSSDVNVDIVNDGTIDSVLLWFELDLAEDVHFSTRVTHAEQHWRQVSQILTEPREVKSGDKVSLSVRYEQFFSYALSVKE